MWFLISKCDASIFSAIVFPAIMEEKTNEEGGVMTHVPKFLSLLLANSRDLTVRLFVSLSMDETIAVASMPVVALARIRWSLDFV